MFGDCNGTRTHNHLVRKPSLNHLAKLACKMFGFIKKVFAVAMTFFSCNALKCISMNNQECKTRPEIIDVNSNEPVFFPYNILVSKCSGNCNNINDPYTKNCVPDVVEDANIKVFNLISGTNEIRHKIA